MSKNFCPKCGKRIKIRETFCENCLIAEYQKRMKERSLGGKLIKNKTMENEEIKEEEKEEEEEVE